MRRSGEFFEKLSVVYGLQNYLCSFLQEEAKKISTQYSL